MRSEAAQDGNLQNISISGEARRTSGEKGLVSDHTVTVNCIRGVGGVGRRVEETLSPAFKLH